MGIVESIVMRNLSVELAGAAMAFEAASRLRVERQTQILQAARRDLLVAATAAAELGNRVQIAGMLRDEVSRADRRAAAGVAWTDVVQEILGTVSA